MAPPKPKPKPKPRPDRNGRGASLSSTASGGSRPTSDIPPDVRGAPPKKLSSRALACRCNHCDAGSFGTQDQQPAVGSLVKLRSLGSLDNLTNGSFVLPEAESLREGMLKEAGHRPLIVPRRDRGRGGSLRSRCKSCCFWVRRERPSRTVSSASCIAGSISTGRSSRLDDESYELSSDLQTKLEANQHGSQHYSQDQIQVETSASSFPQFVSHLHVLLSSGCHNTSKTLAGIHVEAAFQDRQEKVCFSKKIEARAG